MNKWIGTGRLATEPELKTTESGLSVCSLRIAVDRGYGDKKQTDFFTLVFWRRNAENVAKYCEKGDLILIDGELQTRLYEGKTGKITMYEIVVNSFEMLGRKKQSPEKPASDSINEDDLPF